MDLSDLSQNEIGKQEALESFLKDWNIDDAPIQSVVYLANIMKTRPNLSFPASLTPRLNGVLSYCRFKNLKIETTLNEVVSSLKNNSINFTLLGDWAMKSLRPEYPRWINNIEILVPAEEYEKALGVITPIKSDVGIYIHQSLDGDFSLENLLFFTLRGLYTNLLSGQSIESLVTVFDDIKYIYSSKEGIDYEKVWDKAKLYGREFEISLAAKVAADVAPGIFPDQWPELSISGRRLRKRVTDFRFRRDVLSKTDSKILKEGTRRGLIPSVIKLLIWRFTR